MLGIDPSLTSTGYAYRDSGGVVQTGRVTCGDLRGSWRLYYIREQIAKIVGTVNPTLVVYEDYLMRSKQNSRVFHIGELGGVLRTHLWENGFDVLFVPPTLMKSVVAGNGHAEKEVVAQSLLSKFRIAVHQHDESDAAGLLVVGEMRCGMLTPPQKVGKSDRFRAVMECEVSRGRPARPCN